MNMNENTKKIILIAEDEDTNLVVLKTMLRRFDDITIIHAYNGKEALSIVESQPDVYLVLMDLKMPVMDGFEATRNIKKIKPQLPVIAVTAFAMTGDEQRALGAGCDAYIAKPINRNQLYELLSNFGLKKIEN
ncbi:MAG: response regulator [Bacteroidales bacterium]|nr:response regulator [Bacteroidales bacterium]